MRSDWRHRRPPGSAWTKVVVAPLPAMGRLSGKWRRVGRSRAGTAMEAMGQDGGGDAEALEVGQLVGSRWEPAEVRMFKDVVEGQQPARGRFRGCAPTMAVVLDPKGTVERSAMDVANAGGPSATSVEEPRFADDAGIHESAHEAGSRRGGHLVARLVLGTDKDAGVKADEGEPICLAGGPAEAAKRGGALLEAHGRGGGGHDDDGARRAVRSGGRRTVRIKPLRSSIQRIPILRPCVRQGMWPTPP